MIRLPSHSIVNSFVNRFKDAYSALQERETIRPYWKPFSHPILFSYHNELLRQYSYIVVSGAGSPDVNGEYYPIGMLNDAFVWENKQHMFLSREYIDSLCEELYFSERFYAQSLRLALAVFRPALADPLVRSKSSSSSPQEPAPSESSARLCP